MTGSGLSVFVTDRSALVSTAVVAVELSFAGFGSAVGLETVAVLLIVEFLSVLGSTVATTVICTEPGGSAVIVPRASVLLAGHGVDGVQPEPMQYVGFWSCDGRLSKSDTACASDGPLFETVIVYVSWLPAITGSGVSTFRSAMSAFAATA